MTHAMMMVVNMLLAAFVTSSSAHSTHAWHSASHAIAHAAPLERDAVPLQMPSMQAAAKPSADEPELMYGVEPFEVVAATVHGTVARRPPPELPWQPQPLAAARTGRALLHGSKKLSKYPVCNKCRMLRCNRSRNSCSGHCRKHRKLYYCSTKNVPRARPPQCYGGKGQTIEDIQKLPPDTMGTYDTAVVTVPAPYIGCATIGNRPSGCPVRGTAASLPGKGDASVVAARCRAEYYIPDCPGPLLPFGVCECVYRTVRPPGTPGCFRPELVFAPCNTTELEAGYGVGESDGSPSEEGLVVVPSGDVTQTWFSNYTMAGQEPNHVHEVSVRSRSGPVDATLTVFKTVVMTATHVGEGEEIPEDYEHEYDPEESQHDHAYDYDAE